MASPEHWRAGIEAQEAAGMENRAELSGAEVEWRLSAGVVSESSVEHPDRNDDSVLFEGSRQAYGVFDGMGGYEGGATASKLAVETVNWQLKNIPADVDPEIARGLLSDMLVEADQTIKRQRDLLAATALRDMGTTAVLAKLCRSAEGQAFAAIAWVGDSRAYILRAGHLHQLTTDDNLIKRSVMERNGTENDYWELQGRLDNVTDSSTLGPYEQMLYKRRNEISQFLGGGRAVPNTMCVPLESGDRLVMCSDGVSDNLTLEEMEKILAEEGSSGGSASELLGAAYDVSALPRGENPRTKPDDISAIVVDFGSAEPSMVRRGNVRRSGNVIELPSARKEQGASQIEAVEAAKDVDDLCSILSDFETYGGVSAMALIPSIRALREDWKTLSNDKFAREWNRVFDQESGGYTSNKEMSALKSRFNELLRAEKRNFWRR